MSLDRSLRLTVRNFSTVFLVAFMVFFPLHLLHAFFFQSVYEVHELHDAIAGFPEARQVRGVGKAEVAQAKLWFWAIALAEVALIPLIVRATSRVIAVDASGEVPTALGAWRRRGEAGEVSPRSEGAAPGAGALTGAALVALSVGGLVLLVGLEMVDLLPDSVGAFARAAAHATSRAAGGAFLFVALALAFSERGFSRSP